MSLAPQSGPDQETFVKPEAMLRVPMGLASPLWGLFAGAAVTGAAWWWMTRWTQPANLEALFGAAAKVEPPVVAAEPPLAPEAIAELVDPEAHEVVEASPAIQAPTPEAIIEPPLLDAPVGGEAAPISPVAAAVEAEAKFEPKAEVAPAPRARKVAPPNVDPAD